MLDRLKDWWAAWQFLVIPAAVMVLAAVLLLAACGRAEPFDTHAHEPQPLIATTSPTTSGVSTTIVEGTDDWLPVVPESTVVGAGWQVVYSCPSTGLAVQATGTQWRVVDVSESVIAGPGGLVESGVPGEVLDGFCGAVEG